MKKILSVLALFLVAAVAMAQNATTRDNNRMIIRHADGTATVLPIDEVDEVTFSQVASKLVAMTCVDATGSLIKVDCQLTDACSKCEVMAVEKASADVTIAEAKAIVAGGQSVEARKSGVVTLSGLMAGHEYTIVALAYDVYGIPCATCQVNSRTTDEAPFTITYDDVTWKDAHVVITPTDPTMKFYYSSMRMEKVNSEMDGNVNNIPDFDLAWWNYEASLGGGTANDYIQKTLVSGTQDFRTSGDEGVNIYSWGSQGIVYCYGMNAQGVRSTPLCYVIIDTKKPEPSSMTFNAEITGLYPKTVHAIVTPSTDEPYYVSAQKKTFVDYYLNLGLQDEMCFKLIQDDPDFVGLHKGALTVDETVFPALSTTSDYKLILFGFKDGRTTDVFTADFRTLKSGTSSQYSFEYYFLNEAGTDIDTDYMEKVEDGVYRYTVEDGQEVLDTWKALTGYDITRVGETYSFSYDSNDKTGIKYSITGSRSADANGVYGTLLVENPEYGFIKKVIFVK